jgi:hypothetical protein
VELELKCRKSGPQSDYSFNKFHSLRNSCEIKIVGSIYQKIASSKNTTPKPSFVRSEKAKGGVIGRGPFVPSNHTLPITDLQSQAYCMVHIFDH